MVAGTQDEDTTQVVEIIVVGLANSGKTTFIKTISQHTQWENAESQGWLFGQLSLDDALIVHFLEPPALNTFDFMWLRELISGSSAAGYIVVLDSARTDRFGESISILQTIRAYHPDTPVVVAATKQDTIQAWSADDIRLGLRIPEEIPVLPCVSSQLPLVKEAVLQLLYRIFGV